MTVVAVLQGWNPGLRGGVHLPTNAREPHMLYWALMFLVIALIAGLLGFGGVASAATGIAQVLFVIALVLFVVSLFAGFLRRNL